jgi:hypothetical protein
LTRESGDCFHPQAVAALHKRTIHRNWRDLVDIRAFQAGFGFDRPGKTAQIRVSLF